MNTRIKHVIGGWSAGWIFGLVAYAILATIIGHASASGLLRTMIATSLLGAIIAFFGTILERP